MVLSSKKFALICLLALSVAGLFAQNYSYSIIKSMIIPGWGQLASGNNTGYINLATEVVLISSKLYCDNEADINKEHSINYAIKYAHIGSESYSNDYYKTIGRYDSSYFEPNGYNQEVLEQAAELFPGDNVAQQEYINENQIAENMNWRWDSSSNRYKYNSLRRDYHDYEDYSKTLVGVIIANHLISTIDMMIRYKNRNKTPKVSLNTSLKSDYTPMVNLNINF